jgi:O-antigen/teichoic acid export membrane protein
MTTPTQREKLVVNYGQVLRNAGLNLAGRILPAIVAIVAIPIIIRSLGMERYGILSLALVIVSYFGLFDFGLGDATTKFVAGALGRGDFECLPPLIWTSSALIGGFGLLAGILMLLTSPLLASHLFKVSVGLQGEATTAFRAMAAAVPFMLLASGLRGTLEAKQRYDFVNVVSVPTNVANYLIPLVAVLLHTGLVPILCYLVVARAGTCLAYFFLCLRLFPEMRHSTRIDLKGIRPLLAFGGWLAISNLSWPVLLYMDRLVIGSVLPVASLPYYAAPCEVATRLWILPASWAALYPAFSAVGGDRHHELANLCARALKHLALLIGPIVIVAVFFAGKILLIWLGESFQMQSGLVFPILAVGVLITSLCSVPDRLVKGLGRPDIIAKLHVAELPLYGALLVVLVERWGIVGAAVAWTARATAEALIVFAVSLRLVPPSGAAMWRTGMPRVAISLVSLAAAMWIAVRFFNGPAQFALGGLFLLASTAFTWRCVLDRDDRELLRSALNLAT